MSEILYIGSNGVSQYKDPKYNKAVIRALSQKLEGSNALIFLGIEPDSRDRVTAKQKRA